MNRIEAVALYKEISKICQDIGTTAVNLLESKPDDPLIEGYQIRIKAIHDDSAKQIRTIAEKHKLLLKEEKDEIIIFKPK